MRLIGWCLVLASVRAGMGPVSPIDLNKKLAWWSDFCWSPICLSRTAAPHPNCARQYPPNFPLHECSHFLFTRPAGDEVKSCVGPASNLAIRRQ